VESMPELIFNSTNHTYSVDGRKMPSVTGLMKSAGLIDDRWFTEAAAFRGTVVHACTMLDDRGTLLESSVDDGARGRLEAWRSWKRNFGWTAIEVEQPRYSDAGYCGTPDRIMRDSNGCLAVVDIKSGAVTKAHGVQLAGYAHFLYSYPSQIRRFTVQLKDDGRYVMTEFAPGAFATDWAAFQACLTLHNWRRINGIS